MSRPGTRRFIGPLTPAQQRRRERARKQFRRVAALSDAWNIPFREALILYQTRTHFNPHHYD